MEKPARTIARTFTGEGPKLLAQFKRPILAAGVARCRVRIVGRCVGAAHFGRYPTGSSAFEITIGNRRATAKAGEVMMRHWDLMFARIEEIIAETPTRRK